MTIGGLVLGPAGGSLFYSLVVFCLFFKGRVFCALNDQISMSHLCSRLLVSLSQVGTMRRFFNFVITHLIVGLEPRLPVILFSYPPSLFVLGEMLGAL